MLPFIFRVIHVPGKIHFTADALLIYASGDTDPERLELPDNAHMAWDDNTLYDKYDTEVAKMEEELSYATAATLSSIESVTWDTVHLMGSDPTMWLLHDTVLMGFPESMAETPRHNINMAVSPAQR
jgi:hypothetical protein